MEPHRVDPLPSTSPAGPRLSDHDEAGELSPQPTMPPLNLPPNVHAELCEGLKSVFDGLAVNQDAKDDLQKFVVTKVNAAVDLPILNEAMEAALMNIVYDALEPFVEHLTDGLKGKIAELIGCPAPN